MLFLTLKNGDGVDPSTWHVQLGRADVARHITLLCTPKVLGPPY